MTTSTLGSPVRRALRLPGIVAMTRRQARLLGAVAVLGAFAILLVHDLFTNLGGYWLVDFDESRHIASAMEMLHRGDWLVNTYRGAPDFWNLKPPASFWSIMISAQLFGPTVLAARLPSAVATLATAALCTTVAWRWRGPVAAVVTLAAIGSSLHLVDLHSGRTADPDAQFVLLMTSSVISTVWAMRRPWLLVAATTAFSLAFLTKSFHATLALVFAVSVVVIARRTSAVRKRHLLVSLVGFVPLAAWALARYGYDGLTFFQAMISTDVLARGSTVVEDHTGGPDYYLANLQVTLGPWVMAAGMALVALIGSTSWREIRGSLAHSEGMRRAVALTGWVALVFLAFSTAASKLPWYTIPAFPTLCLLVGVGVATALTRVRRPAAAAILIVCLAAVWMGQISIMEHRRTEQDNPVQAALGLLHEVRLSPDQHIYLDPVLGGWQQSFVALVDLNSEATPVDGFDAAYRTDPAARPLILVQQGSSAYQSVMADHPTVLTAHEGWLLVERTSGPAS